MTDEAQTLLNRFDFPGNIRQLKNLVDQISVMEVERLVDAPTLRKFLPKGSVTNRLPMLVGKERDENISERDLLYKVLFDMKKTLIAVELT